MSVLTADSRRDLEIHRYPVLLYGLAPLIALVLQAWLPRLLGKYSWFDLPLIVTVYFALGRRSPIQGTLMGCAVGLFEDALTHHAIDVENRIIRVGLIFLLSLLSSAICLFVNRFLLGLVVEIDWPIQLYIALGNSVIALFVFPFLDRFQVRD
jgi:rod shape-determining protein MreD